jgi:cellulose synthase/poly-beta-1,6-N-acetylglucosamine synthase-like glycosyltransferase
MREMVRLPKGEELNEWLAINTIDCFNEIAMLYDSVKDNCTSETCPNMTAGSSFEYLWADGVKVKKPVKLCARVYVENLNLWVEEQLNDDKIFPGDVSAPFPANFLAVVKTIFKRLFRIYAHIYHHHYENIRYEDTMIDDSPIFLFFSFSFYFLLFIYFLFYFILFYFILFYFILFYFILFYFILFYFIFYILYFILFYFILFYFILFYFYSMHL